MEVKPMEKFYENRNVQCLKVPSGDNLLVAREKK